MNHITGPTSHIRGIYGKTPASHAQMYDTRLKQEHLMCFRYRYWQGYRLCPTTESHYEARTGPAVWRSISREYSLTTRALQGQGGWQRRQEEMKSLPGEYLRIPPDLDI